MATTPATGNTGTTATAATANGTSTTNLSPWVAPYITDYLGKSQALANEPYQLYQGPLTAGASGLQSQAFQGIGNLTVPSAIGDATNTAGNVANAAGGMGYTPVGSDFTTAYAQQYMNPYLMTALNLQLEEARRQAEITRMENAARLTKAGAYGGSRQATMESELQRNMAQNMANITGQGYLNAYEQARNQFNIDQQRKIGEAQFGAEYGLKGLAQQLAAAQAQGSLGRTQQEAEQARLNAQLNAGGVQRDIEQQGITADWEEFQRQVNDPYKKAQFMRDMISGLPVGSVTNAPNPMSDIGSMLTILGSMGLLKNSGGLSSLADLFKTGT